MRLSRIPRTRPSSGRRRRCRCRAVQTRASWDRFCAGHFPPQVARKEIPAADTCRASSGRSAKAWRRDTSRVPSRPRRDCPRCSSGRTGAPSISDRARSTTRPRNRAADDHRKSPRCHLRPSDTHGCGRGRAAGNPRPCRRANNPRAPCPTDARKDTAPSAASRHSRAARSRVGSASCRATSRKCQRCSWRRLSAATVAELGTDEKDKVGANIKHQKSNIR